MTSILTNKPFSENYYKILEFRKKFTSNQKKLIDTFHNALDETNLIFLVSETGSGKSTQFPIHVLSHNGVFNNEFGKDFKKNTDFKGMVVSQPRRLTSKSIAERMADQLDVQIGKEVGYQYRFENNTSDNTIMTFMTDGLLLQLLYNNINRYSVVMIDEVHTRSPYIDIIMYLIKNYLSQFKNENKNGSKKKKSINGTDSKIKIKKNKTKLKKGGGDVIPVKFILMSATINIGDFEKYYENIKVSSISAEGRMFPVKEIYHPTTIERNNIPFVIVSILSNLVKLKDTKDILIFLPSKYDINVVSKQIQESPFANTCISFELYSGISQQLENLATSIDLWKTIDDNELYKLTGQRRINATIRKIICSSNVAETGITIDGVNVVIDSGMELSAKFDNVLRMKILSFETISKANSSQRCGRAGRTSEGTCYRLVENVKCFKGNYPEPPILHEDLLPITIDLFNCVKKMSIKGGINAKDIMGNELYGEMKDTLTLNNKDTNDKIVDIMEDIGINGSMTMNILNDMFHDKIKEKLKKINGGARDINTDSYDDSYNPDINIIGGKNDIEDKESVSTPMINGGEDFVIINKDIANNKVAMIVKHILMSLLDPIPESHINATLNFMYNMEILSKDGSISPLGTYLQEIQLLPELGLTLLAAKKYNQECYDDVIIITSFLFSKDRFEEYIEAPYKDKPKIIKSYANKKGGLYAFKKIADKLKNSRAIRIGNDGGWYKNDKNFGLFCRKNHLKYKMMDDFIKTTGKLRKLMKDIKSFPNVNIKKSEFDKDCILAAFKYGYKENIIESRMKEYTTKTKKISKDNADSLMTGKPRYYIGLTMINNAVKFNTSFPEI